MFPSNPRMHCVSYISKKSEKIFTRLLSSASPPSLTPSQVAGRVLWSRQLFRKIEAPMLILKKKLDMLKVIF